MDAWDAPRLSDLKATPASVLRARKTLDILSEPLDIPQTERRMVGGREVDIITGTPPPVRREVAPAPPVQEQMSFSGLVLDEDDLPLTDDETDDEFFDSWTLEPAENRGGFPQIQSRGAAIAVGGIGLLVVAMVAQVAVDTVKVPDEAAPLAEIELAEAAVPVAVEPASVPAPAAAPVEELASAPVAEPASAPVEELAPEPIVVASEPVAAPTKTRARRVERAIVVAEPVAVGQGWEEPQAPNDADRSTMYTPATAAEVTAAEAPIVEEEPGPERESAPATSGTNPWGKTVVAKPTPPTATNPWGKP